jgi:TonB family protein
VIFCRRLNHRAACCLVGVLLVMPGNFNLRFQDPKPSAPELTQKIANALVNGHTHDVVVFDLCGPRARLSALGQDFADSLSKSLRNDFPGLSVRDRDAVRTAIEQNHLAPAVICNKQAAQWLASQLHVDSFLVGFLTDVNNQLSVGVEAVRVGNGNVISEFTATAPLSNEMKARLDTVVGPKHEIDSYHLVQQKGTAPKCVYCPSPRYSSDAADAQIEGTVVLSALIGLNGRARDISVKKSMPFGLTGEAIRALESWIFAPGKSADGEKLEVEIPIEVTFKHYK